MKILRSTKRNGCGCCLLIVLLILILLGALGFLLARRGEAAPPPPDDAMPVSTTTPAPALLLKSIVLVRDDSPSLWECDQGGPGSDPDLLRVDATRLFITYLGADTHAVRYQLGLLSFGGEVRTLAPLSDLAHPATRQALLQAAGDPQPISWTDPLAALQAAETLLNTSPETSAQRVVILLTDGEPVLPGSRPDDAAYRQALRRLAARFTDSGTTLFVVLLNNPAGACSQRVAQSWYDFWADLAAGTPAGGLYPATQANQLLPIYHALVRQIAGAEAGSTLADNLELPAGGEITFTIPVTTGLASLTLTVWKQAVDTVVQLSSPPVDAAADRGVTSASRGAGHEEVWQVQRPASGPWVLHITGQGRVSVWQDQVALPTPPPALSPIASPTPTLTPTPTLASTPRPAPSATPTETRAPAIPTTTAATPGAASTEGAAALPPRMARWLLVSAALALPVSGMAVLLWRRSRPRLSGQLRVAASPLSVEPPLPRDLSAERVGQTYLGERARGAWRLAGWTGSLQLRASATTPALLVPLHGDATLNDRPLRRPTPLQDGDMIGCGDYRITYENLLA